MVLTLGKFFFQLAFLYLYAETQREDRLLYELTTELNYKS